MEMHDATDVEKYIKENTFDVQHAPCAVLVVDACFRAYTEIPEAYGGPYAPQLIYMRDDLFWQCTSDALLQEAALARFEYYRKDHTWFDRILTEQEAVFQENQRIFEHITADGISAAAFEEYTQSFSRWWTYGAIGEDKGSVVQHRLEQNLVKKHGLSMAAIHDFINETTHPEEISGFSAARVRFLDMCIASAKGESADTEGYIRDFFYTKANYLDAVILTQENVLNDIRTELERGLQAIEEERANTLATYASMRGGRAGSATNVVLDEEDRVMHSYLQQISQWVDIRKVRMMKQFYWLFVLTHMIERKTGIPYQELARYMYKELIAAIDGIRPSEETLRKRVQNSFFVYQTSGEHLFFYDEDAKHLFTAVGGTNTETVVKGTVASKGDGTTVHGIVCIMRDPTKDTWTPGSVLVTSMTRPEFVPFMRDALAIVTDEGGIACHAAIVSRELKKPCIIGTKIATSVLKDGDLVEIDIQNGIVRKI